MFEKPETKLIQEKAAVTFNILREILKENTLEVIEEFGETDDSIVYSFNVILNLLLDYAFTVSDDLEEFDKHIESFMSGIQQARKSFDDIRIKRKYGNKK